MNLPSFHTQLRRKGQTMTMHRNIARKLATLASGIAAVVAAALAVPAEVRADDTDVFFPKQEVVSTIGQINPNVLFVIDTSGSMGTDDFSDGDSRLERVQKAFVEIMDGLSPNVNVGLARYSNSQGGPIMFPVAPIDELVEKVDTAGDGNSTFTFPITDNVSEAMEAYNNNVTLAPATLQVRDNIPDVTSGTVTSRLSTTGEDEAEEYSNGRVNGGTKRCPNDLQFINDGNSQTCKAATNSATTPGNQIIGLRFNGLSVPQGAIITSAFISFDAATTSNTAGAKDAATGVRIHGEKSTASVLFTAGNPTVGKPSSRAKTTKSVLWTNISTTDATADTPNLKDIVQEIVDQGAWPSANASMTFIFDAGSSGFRRTFCGGMESPNCGSEVTKRPLLSISYSVPAGNTSNPETLALRFNKVQVPKGTKITAASLLFHIDTPLSSTGLTVDIDTESVDNSAAFTTAAGSLDARSWGGSPISWTIPSTTVDEDDLVSPDISSLITNVVGRSGWCGGNSLTVRLKFKSGADRRSFIGKTQDPNLAPLLVLSYSQKDPALETGCNRTSLVSQITAPKTDDSFEIDDGTDPNFPSCSLIYLGATPSGAPASGCGGSSQTNKKTIAGLRFSDLNIPQGAKIVSAFVDFTDAIPSGTDSSSASFTISGEANSFPDTFNGSAAHISARQASFKQTAATVAWTPASVSAGALLTTPDLKTVVQEIVNRSDWKANNELVLYVAGTTGTRTVRSSDGSASASPKLRLVIEGFGGRLTVREKLKTVVNGFSATGLTPTIGAFYEAARYFRGEDAFYGRTRGGGDTLEIGTGGDNTSGIDKMAVNGRAVYDYSKGTPVHNYPPGCSDFNLVSTKCSQETWTGTTTYKSPIGSGCQSNNIVILSDGIPNNTTTTSKGASNVNAVTLVQKMIGKTCPTKKDSTGATQNEWKCGDELADFLRNQDQVSDTRLKGAQNVTTYTIAFGPDLESGSTDAVGAEFLENIAKAGGGKFFTASTAEQVAVAFKEIIAQILDKGTTFVAPSVTVNTFNRLTNRNELYFALFQPQPSVRWPGNLKRYQILQKGGSAPQVYDQDGNLAVDPSTGFFTKESCSVWTVKCDDGDNVELGGAASKLPDTRSIYTNLNGNAGIDLATPSNTVGSSNSGITADMLGAPGATATERANILNWAVGQDAADEDGDGDKTENRLALGDPLHSEPLLVSYGGTDVDPDLTVFYGDNQGYLHAVDAKSGIEQFAFIPRGLLKNLSIYFENSDNYKSRPYGMDGPLMAQTVSSKKLLYAGMRRGGRSYFAMDVTDRKSPKLAFEIEGGKNTTSGDFRELGQSWSPMVLANVRINGVDYGGKSGNPPVLLFSGGYDPAHDAKTDLFSGSTRNGDSQGRAVYAVHSVTGKLLWWAGFKDVGLNTKPDLALPDMVYSIPSAPVPVDLDGNGQTDRIYVADSGGQMFRIILGKDDSKIPSLSNATGSMIATISKPGIADSRHFFNSPDVALIGEGVTKPFLALSIGTGHRERPLDTGNKDRFYILKDLDLANEPLTDLLIKGEDELYDATANLAGSSDATTAQKAREAIFNAKGLFIRLGASEKVLSESSTLSNQVIFASFEPPGSVADEALCQARTGISRFYQINVLDATPAQDFNSTGTLTLEDRSKVIPVSGLPPDPVVLFPSIRVATKEDGSQEVCNGATCGAEAGQLVAPLVCTGAICFPLGLNRQFKKSYWRAN